VAEQIDRPVGEGLDEAREDAGMCPDRVGEGLGAVGEAGAEEVDEDPAATAGKSDDEVQPRPWTKTSGRPAPARS
jgi:hypothetical protein